VELAPPTPVAIHADGPPNSGHTKSTIPQRESPMLSVNHPEVTPPNISTTPNKNLALPPAGVFKIGRDTDPSSPGGGGPSGGSGGVRSLTQPRQLVEVSDPPPLPEKPKPESKIISKGVITGLALALPKPTYPPIAKKLGIQGAVSVQVLIDETGHVISAKAINGSPFLTSEAQKAAYQARFSPTRLSDQPVKVSGVITYHFALNE